MDPLFEVQRREGAPDLDVMYKGLWVGSITQDRYYSRHDGVDWEILLAVAEYIEANPWESVLETWHFTSIGRLHLRDDLMVAVVQFPEDTRDKPWPGCIIRLDGVDKKVKSFTDIERDNQYAVVCVEVERET